MNNINDFDYDNNDDFSVVGRGFENMNRSNCAIKKARGGGKRTKKSAQENNEKIYNSKTARHKANVMMRFSTNPSSTSGKNVKGNLEKVKIKPKGKSK